MKLCPFTCLYAWSPRLSNEYNKLYVETRTKVIVQSEIWQMGACCKQRPDDHWNETSQYKWWWGSVLTYAMPTEGDRFRCILPRTFLAFSLSCVLVETFDATPYVGDINSIQQVYGRTFPHKLSEHMVSTCTTIFQRVIKHAYLVYKQKQGGEDLPPLFRRPTKPIVRAFR